MGKPKFVPTMEYCQTDKEIVEVFGVCAHMQFDGCGETKYGSSLACAGQKNVYSSFYDVGW